MLRADGGGRKGIRPVKTEWWGAGVVVCLERGADLHMAQLMPLPVCHSLSLVSAKSRLVLPFWNRLTRVVLDKGPLNGCVCVCVCTADDTSLAIVDDLFRCDWFGTLGYSGSRPSCESATLGNDRRRHDLLQLRLDVVYTYLFFVHGHSVSLAPAMSLTDRRTDRQCCRWTSFAVAIYMQM